LRPHCEEGKLIVSANEEIKKLEAELNEAHQDLRDTLTEVSAKAEHGEGVLRSLRPDQLIVKHPIEALCLGALVGFVVGSRRKASAVGPAMIVSLLGYAIAKRISNGGRRGDAGGKASNGGKNARRSL
jgi:hypothetical protein